MEELLGSIKPNMTEDEVELLLNKYFPKEKFESSGAPRSRASSRRRRLTYDNEEENQLIEQLDTRTQHELRVWLDVHHMRLRDFFQYIVVPFIGSMYLSSGNGTRPFNEGPYTNPDTRNGRNQEWWWFNTLLIAMFLLQPIGNMVRDGVNYVRNARERMRQNAAEAETQRRLTEERRQRTEALRLRSGQPNISMSHTPINQNRPSSSLVDESRNTFIMRNFWRDDANAHGGTNLLITNRPNISSRVETIDTGEENGHMTALVMPIVERRPDAPIRCQAIKDDGTRCTHAINIRETNKGGRWMCFCGVHQSWARQGSTKRSVNNWAVDNLGGGASASSQEPPSRVVELDKNNLKF